MRLILLTARAAGLPVLAQTQLQIPGYEKKIGEMISSGPTLSWSYLEESSDPELAAPEISTMTKILVATENNTCEFL